MKKGLLLVFAVMFYGIVNAQWSVGLNLGTGFPTGDAGDYSSAGIQWDLNGQYMVTPKIGITANLGQNHFGEGETPVNYDYGNPLAGGRWTGTATFNYKVSMTTFSVGANYYFAAPKNGFGYYLGLGLAFNNVTLKTSAIDEGRYYTTPVTFNTYRNELTFEDQKGSGVGIIPRAGVTYGFSGNWMLRGELGYHITGIDLSNSNYTSLGLTSEETALNYVPLLIGVVYNF